MSRMNKRRYKRNKMFPIGIVLGVIIILTTFYIVNNHRSVINNKIVAKKIKIKKHPHRSFKAVSYLKKNIDWRKPSENKPYPHLYKYKNVWVHVSIKNKRVYIMSGRKVLYTMFASPGAPDSPTPKGKYFIQSERGYFFYNAGSREGAHYWVSFKDHGVYLFHTVPTDANGNYIPREAALLGKVSHSHGCVRLGVPDAKWFYNNIKFGTEVVIN